MANNDQRQETWYRVLGFESIKHAVVNQVCAVIRILAICGFVVVSGVIHSHCWLMALLNYHRTQVMINHSIAISRLGLGKKNIGH